MQYTAAGLVRNLPGIAVGTGKMPGGTSSPETCEQTPELAFSLT